MTCTPSGTKDTSPERLMAEAIRVPLRAICEISAELAVQSLEVAARHIDQGKHLLAGHPWRGEWIVANGQPDGSVGFAHVLDGHGGGAVTRAEAAAMIAAHKVALA